jgi:DNA-directed RNA polymerase II subunit RPB2
LSPGEILPHIGLARDDTTNNRKALYFALMIRKLLLVYVGTHQCDDRDHYSNKRIDTAGSLMTLLMRQLFRNMYRTLTTTVNKLADTGKLLGTNVGELVNHKRITSGFKYDSPSPHL